MSLWKFCLMALAVALLCLGGVLLISTLAGCTEDVVPSAHADVPDTSPAASRQYQKLLTREWRLTWGLNAPLAVAAGQIEQESGWNPNARSPYAKGIAQFTDATAAQFADDNGEVDAFNPDWALRAQSRYMRVLYVRVHYPHECDLVGATLSEYNGGPGWHDKRQARAADPTDFWDSVRIVNPGVRPEAQRENEQYSQVIVFKRQYNYVTWGGETVCI